MKTHPLPLIALTAFLPLAGYADQYGKAKHSSPSTEATAETKNQEFLFASLDYICWKPYVDDLEYAISGIKSGVPFNDPVSTANVSPGKTFGPKFKYSSGFKAGAGYTFGTDREWDLFSTYTWLESTAKSSVTSDGFTESFSTAGTKRFYPMWIHPAAVIVIPDDRSLAFGKAHWNLFYQTLDLELARRIKVLKRLSLVPHGGLRAAWIDQKYRVNYIIGNGTAPPNQTFATFKVPMKNNFWGVGLRAALDSFWHFSPHFALFGNVGASLLWGQFSIRYKNIETARNTGATILTPRGTIVDLASRSHDVVPELDAALGLHAETGLFKDRYRLEANVSWEQLVWFNQNQLFYFADFVGLGNGMRQNSNLSLQGITIDVKFHF